MTFEGPFPKPAATANAVYDWVDVASGTGYNIYYGANVADGTASTAYVLTNNQFYSDSITTFDSVGQAMENFLNVDFDVQFNLAQMMNGDLIVSIPIGIGRITGETGGILTCNISGAIHRVIDGVEETLGEWRSSDFVLNDATNAGDFTVLTNKIPIDNKLFKF